MDPLLVSALGVGLVSVLTKLLEKGVVDPALEKGLEPVQKLVTRGYDKKQDEAKLRQAVEAALKNTTGKSAPADWAQYRWVTALETLKADPNLAARAAAAAVEMTADDPARLPPDLLKALKIEDERAAFAAFLFKLRRELVQMEDYSAGIQYADELHAINRLDGLYELVAGMAEAVVTAEGGKVLRVQIPPLDARAQEQAYLENIQREFDRLSLVGRSEREAVAANSSCACR